MYEISNAYETACIEQHCETMTFFEVQKLQIHAYFVVGVY